MTSGFFTGCRGAVWSSCTCPVLGTRTRVAIWGSCKAPGEELISHLLGTLLRLLDGDDFFCSKTDSGSHNPHGGGAETPTLFVVKT